MSRTLPFFLILAFAGCSQPATFVPQPSGFGGYADYEVTIPNAELGLLHLEYGVASLLMADGKHHLVHTLNGSYSGGWGVGQWSRALGEDNRVLRFARCIDPECHTMIVDWSLDGTNTVGWGFLTDLQEDGELEPWQKDRINWKIGSRVPIKVNVENDADSVDIHIEAKDIEDPLEAGYLAGRFTFQGNADFPAAIVTGMGTNGESTWTRTDMQIGGVLPGTPPWTFAEPGPRSNAQMFLGEDVDVFNAGFTPIAALDHLKANSATAAEALDAGGCVVIFRVNSRPDAAIGEQGEQVEIGIMPAKGGPPEVYLFYSYETSLLGSNPLFSTVGFPRVEERYPMVGDCGAVRSSPGAISAVDFLSQARQFGFQSGGDLAFQWFAADRAGQKPLVPGTNHFGLLLYPRGVQPGEPGVVNPYVMQMDADIGWWESMTLSADDFPRLDSSE